VPQSRDYKLANVHGRLSSLPLIKIDAIFLENLDLSHDAKAIENISSQIFKNNTKYQVQLKMVASPEKKYVYDWKRIKNTSVQKCLTVCRVGI